MRISDWSSDVCSSDLGGSGGGGVSGRRRRKPAPAGHPLSRVFAFARPANAPSPRTRSGVQRASNAGVLGSVEGDHRSRSPSPTPTSPAFAEASLRILSRWERKFRACVRDYPKGIIQLEIVRSEERRVGNECVRTCRTRWLTD